MMALITSVSGGLCPRRALYFVVTGIQFWATDFMITAMGGVRLLVVRRNTRCYSCQCCPASSQLPVLSCQLTLGRAGA